MKTLLLVAIIFVSFIGTRSVNADIHSWTDENGIRHFSNQSPPAGSKVFIRNWGPRPTYSSETPKQIDDDHTMERQDLENRLSDTEDKLSKTLEQVKGLEDRIREANNRTIQVVEAVDDSDSDPIDDDSISESENPILNTAYGYPVVVIRNRHYKDRSLYSKHRFNHRPYHRRGDHPGEQRLNEHRNRKKNIKSHHLGKYHDRGRPDKKYRNKNQNRHTNHFRSTVNRGRRIGVHSSISRYRKNHRFYGIQGRSSRIGTHHRRPRLK